MKRLIRKSKVFERNVRVLGVQCTLSHSPTDKHTDEHQQFLGYWRIIGYCRMHIMTFNLLFTLYL